MFPVSTVMHVPSSEHHGTNMVRTLTTGQPSWKSWTALAEDLQVPWGSPDQYQIVQKVGRGKFSQVSWGMITVRPTSNWAAQVYEGIDIDSGEKCLIKILSYVKEKKIKREIKILQNLAGGPNIIKLLNVTRDPTSDISSLITEYVHSTDHKIIYPRFTDRDVRFYMFELLKVIIFIPHHLWKSSFCVQGPWLLPLERDNASWCQSTQCHDRPWATHGRWAFVLVANKARWSSNLKQLRLTGWGQAEFYHPNTEYTTRVVSSFYKGPELLLDFQKYDYSLDMWNYGCMFASMVRNNFPCWRYPLEALNFTWRSFGRSLFSMGMITTIFWTESPKFWEQTNYLHTFASTIFASITNLANFLNGKAF